MMSSVRFAAMLVVLAMATGAGASSGGIPGRSQAGCGVGGCHGPNDDAAVTIDPVPAGAGYDLTISVEDNPETLDNPTNLGGFNLSANFGRLTPDPDDSANVQNFSAHEVGHTFTGNDQRTWSLHWEPEGLGFCSLDLFAAANSVNGNGVNDPGDHWGLVSQTLAVNTSGDAADPGATIVHPAQNGLYFAGGRIGNSPTPTVIGSIELAVSATDDVGIDTVEVLDTDLLGEASLGEASFDASSGLFTLFWTTTGSEPPGLHTVTFRVTDCAGNVTDVTREVLVL